MRRLKLRFGSACIPHPEKVRLELVEILLRTATGGPRQAALLA